MNSVHFGVRARVLKGLSANVYGQCVAVIIQLVGVPILLRAWGTQAYGEWLILFAIPGFLSMTDLGFTLSAANDMVQNIARGNRTDALGTFLELATFVYAMSLGGLLAVTALLPVVPLEDFVRLRTMSYSDARLILWFLLAEMFVRLTDGVNHAGFRASGEYSFHIGLYWTALLAQYLGIWITASLGFPPVRAAMVYFALRCAMTPAVTSLLLRRHHWLALRIVSVRGGRLRALARPAFANLAIPLGQALNIQGILLVTGAVLGPVAVVVLSSLRTLTRFALQIVLAISNAAEPELALAFGAEQRKLVSTLFVHSLRASLWLVVAALFFLSALGHRAFAFWTHGKVPFDNTLFYLLLGSSALAVLWYTPLVTLKAANLHMRLALLYLVSAAGSVLVAGILLTATSRLASSGIALIAMDAVMVIYAMRAVAAVTGTETFPALRLALNPMPLLRLGIRRSASM